MKMDCERSRIISIIIFFLLYIIGGSSIADEGDLEWERTYGNFNRDYGYSVQQTSDGGYILAGYTYFNELMDCDVALVKTNSDGDLQWQKTFGGGREDYGHSVQQTSDGGYIIVGKTESYGAGSEDVYLVKIDSDGNQLWQKTVGGSSSDVGYSVQRTNDGGYIIVGTTYSYGAGYSDVYLVKTDSGGEMLWHKTFGGSDYDRGYFAQQTSDDGYIITGTTYSYGAGGYDIYLAKTNSDGDQLWQKTFGGSYYNDYGYSVQQTSDSGYIIAGYTYEGGGGVRLVKTDSDGEMLWEKTFDGTDFEGGKPVQQTSDGGFIVTGSIDPYGFGSADVYLAKTNSVGETLWEKTFGEASDDDRAYSVQQTFDGGYIIAGYQNAYLSSGNRDFYLIKVSSGITSPTIHFVSDVSAGDESVSPATLVVTLSQVCSETVTVDYSVTGGTAIGNGADYTLDSGTLTFLPGDIFEDILLTIVDDSLDEADETVIVTLSNPVNAVLSTKTTHTYTILDDEIQSTIAFSSTGSCGDESVNSVTLAVSLSQTSTEKVTVDYSITGGTATGGGVDYALASDTLTFSPGETLEYIPLIIVEDSLDEADEAIIVTLSDPVNAVLGTISAHIYTIIDDDAGGDNQWEKIFGGSDSDGASSVQQTFDGGYIIAGYTGSYESYVYDVYLIKTDSDGDLQWQKTFGGGGNDRGSSVQQTFDGGFIVAGTTNSYQLGDDVYLVKTNSVGDIQWEKTFGGSSNDAGSCVQQTSDGGFIIAGQTASYGSLHSGYNNVYLVKTNSDGDLQWQKTFGASDYHVYDYGRSVQQTSDGGFIIAGTTYIAGIPAVYIVKTNTIGVLQWEKTFSGNGGAGGGSVQQTADGGYIIAGDAYSFGSGNDDVYLVKANSDGDQLWQKTFGGSEDDYGYSVQQTTDGGYIIAGSTTSYGAGSKDVYLVKTNSDGDLQWQKTFGGNDYDEGYSTQQTTDGGYIIAGSANLYGSVYLIKVSGELIGLIADFCGVSFGPADGYVDVWDLMQFAGQWHTGTGDSNWDAKFDLAGPNFGGPDGYIDVWDLMTFADHWHEGERP